MSKLPMRRVEVQGKIDLQTSTPFHFMFMMWLVCLFLILVQHLEKMIEQTFRIPMDNYRQQIFQIFGILLFITQYRRILVLVELVIFNFLILGNFVLLSVNVVMGSVLGIKTIDHKIESSLYQNFSTYGFKAPYYRKFRNTVFSIMIVVFIFRIYPPFIIYQGVIRFSLYFRNFPFFDLFPKFKG